MPHRFSRKTLLAAAALSFGALGASPALAVIDQSTAAIDTDEAGVAMQGYDPVAYFTNGAPTKGDARFKLEHDGATYLFANARNLKKFKANPNAYLPQYGGFCAMGASLGRKFEGDPKVWKIVDGKLYLNFNPDVGKRWSQDVPGNITRANQNWPTIKNKTPHELN